MSPAAHIGQVPTPIPMVPSPHTPQAVISTANTTTTNASTPVSTVNAGRNRPTPSVTSPSCPESALTNTKKPEELPVDALNFDLLDPERDVPNDGPGEVRRCHGNTRQTFVRLLPGYSNPAAKRLRMRKFVAIIRAFVVVP